MIIIFTTNINSHPPKIAVVAICKNEEKHVLRWLDSVSCADYICILDTGSTDNTLSLINQWKKDHSENPTIVNKIILGHWQPEDGQPFHFDEARNESKKLVPSDADLLFYPDLDEFCQPGWRDQFDRIFNEHPDVLRISYQYAAQCDESEKVITYQWYDWCFRNDPRYKWYNIVHECCDLFPLASDTCTDSELKQQMLSHTYYTDKDFILIKHLPDLNKSRSFYSNLMRERWYSNKDDLQIGCYYLSDFTIDGGESSFLAVETADEIINHALQVGAHASVCSSINERRAVLWHLWYSKANHLNALGRTDEAILAYHTAISYMETSLLPYISLIDLYISLNDYSNAAKIIDLADKFSRATDDWTCDRMNFVYDLPLRKVLVYYNLGNYSKAAYWANEGYNMWVESGWSDQDKLNILVYNKNLLKEYYEQ